jgi:diguanylate cyclase (GGDEF)-like protein
LYGAKNKEEMINRINEIFPDESLDKIKDGIIAITKGKKRIDLELVNHTLDGRVLQVSISHLVVPGYYESDFSRVLSSRVDITEQKKLEEKLRYMATHDPLTGLYSRTFFEEELSRHSNKRFLPLGVIMFDVDGLKYINDTFGHVKGDRLLKTTAKILSKVFRSSEILARIGGDEFAVILPNVNDEILKSVIERLELQLSRVNKPRDDTGKINISYGYSIRQNEIVDMAGVLRDADENLYSNKMARR